MFSKIFPVVAGIIIGAAINWVFMSFTFDYRIAENENDIQDVMGFLDSMDSRVSKLESETLGEINARLASIETSINYLRDANNGTRPK